MSRRQFRSMPHVIARCRLGAVGLPVEQKKAALMVNAAAPGAWEAITGAALKGVLSVLHPPFGPSHMGPWETQDHRQVITQKAGQSVMRRYATLQRLAEEIARQRERPKPTPFCKRNDGLIHRIGRSPERGASGLLRM
jgi:hypothetical protein